MKKLCLGLVLLTPTLLLVGCSTRENYSTESIAPKQSITDASLSPKKLVLAPASFTAGFEIYTNGTKRVFTNAMYHNQSNEIYIEKSNPQVVVVKQSGLTWEDFFTTLPFSLEKDCLVTGTNQTFCTTETQRLYFYVNEQEDPSALDRVIEPNDFLRVEYR